MVVGGNLILQNTYIIWLLLLYFNLRNLKVPNSTSLIRFQYIPLSFSVFKNFFKVTSGELIFGWNQFCKTAELQTLKDLHSKSIIRTKCLLHGSALFFSVFQNVLKIKRGDLAPCREPILQNDWIIWPLLLSLDFKNLKNTCSMSFISFQCIILYHSSHLNAFYSSGLLIFLKFPQIKEGDLFSWGEPALQNDWIIWSPFYISVLKFWRSQILCHFLSLGIFYIIQLHFSKIPWN